jgi:mannosyl-oligosaccharide alpha-1,2-mannosidase
MASNSIVLAVLGSLSLEFTRLAQITGNDKYFDAIQRVMNELEKWQDNTTLPGMWPAMVDSTKYNKTILLGSPYVGLDETFTLGALADSTYEYLPKVSPFRSLLWFPADNDSNSCSLADR